MVYDLNMLKSFYASYKGKMEHVRAALKRPLTLAEKILYAHLYDVADLKDYKRGEDYVNFRPDRVAMQDATAQMALLQFMNAGKDQVAVPSTVHCDHLIQAYKGAKADIATARLTNEEVYDFLRDVSSRYGIGFWKPGEVLLLENLRFYAEEEGKPRGLAEDATDEEKAAAKKAVKESQKEFTKKLASYADCYVNDAFGTAHRAHASTALIAKYFDVNNKMFGYLMEKEVKAVDKVLNDIKRPFTAIMGGSKVSSKIEIIENLLSKVDNLIIAGGMTYTFTKAMGGKIGISICEDDKLDLALDLMKKAKEKGVNLVLAVDAKIADAFSNDANTKFCAVDEIPDGWEGLDIGPKTEEIFANVIKESKTILWNGPTGVFEFDNFTHGSRAVGEAIVEATKNGAFSLVGGGDSVACVNKFGLASGVSYVSTGGGALLEAIEGKVLPGIAAIQE